MIKVLLLIYVYLSNLQSIFNYHLKENILQTIIVCKNLFFNLRTICLLYSLEFYIIFLKTETDLFTSHIVIFSVWNLNQIFRKMRVRVIFRIPGKKSWKSLPNGNAITERFYIIIILAYIQIYIWVIKSTFNGSVMFNMFSIWASAASESTVSLWILRTSYASAQSTTSQAFPESWAFCSLASVHSTGKSFLSMHILRASSF